MTIALGLALTSAACLFGSARAERLETIRVPESVPDIQNPYDAFVPLTSPSAVNSSWAVPDHRPIGVHLDNYNLTLEQIDAAQSTGCRLVRLAIPMEHFIEGDDEDWAVLDQVVSRLNRAQIQVLPVLQANTPVAEFYVDFCRKVATRYAGTFTYYQLLDDINYKVNIHSRQYADLISQVRTAIVLADADAKIVSGGIRGVDLTYLEMLEDHYALKNIDVIAFNLFPSPGGIESYSRGNMAEHSLPYMEQAIEWAAARGKPVWVTSFGVSTAYSWVGVDQAAQAAMYARGVLYLGWLGIERVILSSIQDSDPAYKVPFRCCGLLDVQGAPKASFFALRGLNEALRGCYHIEPPFIYQGFTFQQPDAADLFIEGWTSEPGEDDVGEFQVYGLNVYGFWFYEPAAQQYKFVYWLADDTKFDVLITLNVGHIGLDPLSNFGLLDQGTSAVPYAHAKNMVYMPYLSVSTIPAVLSFNINGNGRGAT
jgi:hypothetical protein